MDNIIEIKDLSFGYKETLFNNFFLNIKRGQFITIIGPNSSGKSTLLKLINGTLNYKGSIYINNELISKSNLNSSISYVNSSFINEAETVLEKISGICSDLEKIKMITELLKLESISNCSISTLSSGEKQLVNIACALILEPDILLLDEAFSMISPNLKDKILKVLKKWNKEKNMTILYITKDIEDILYSKDLLVISDYQVKYFDKTEGIFEKDGLIKDLDLELPFMVSLSKKIKYYGLVDKVILNMKKMVDELWK